MSSRTCPDWPMLMEVAPELQFMHYTVAEANAGYRNRRLFSVFPDEVKAFKDKFFGDSKKFVEYYKTKFTRPIAYHVAGAAA